MKILLMLPPVDVYGAFKNVAPSRPPLGIEIKKFRPDIVGISLL